MKPCSCQPREGLWYALGAVAAIAAAGLVRKGSRAVEPVVLGYHCTQHPIQGPYHGMIRGTYRERFQEIIAHLPYAMQDDLDDIAWRTGGFDWRDPPEEETDRREAFDEFIQGWLHDREIEWIFVSEVPLSWAGGNITARSSYGDECYRVSIDPRALLGYLADEGVATGHRQARASAVLYRADVARPQLEWVDVSAQERPPFLDFPRDAPWGGTDVG